MDFVDWCTSVLDSLLAAHRELPRVRANGIYEHELAERVFPENPPSVLAFSDSSHAEPRTRALQQALGGLESCGLVEVTPIAHRWKVTEKGRTLRDNLPAVWQPICEQNVADDCRGLLHAINRLSPQPVDNSVELSAITSEQLFGVPEVTGTALDVLAALAELCAAGLASRVQQFNNFTASATYRGLVWETRRALTIESQFIDQLVAEWETTSVEFKREVHTNTKDEKAELIKDLLGLANTLASGRRWLIIGFDDKTHSYVGRPDPKLTQDHLEQLVNLYIEPNVRIRYTVVDYRLGPVGKLEVVPDRAHLPYRVARDVKGSKKQISAEQVFVRHGSQTEAPTEAECQALEEEGERARAAARQAPGMTS